MGIFLRSTEATPCEHLLKWQLTPRKPPCGHRVHDRHGHGSPVKNRWRFSKFCKKYETLALTLKIGILQDNGFKELELVLFGSLFQGLHILFYNIFGQTLYWSTAKPWTSPKNVQMTLKDQSFVNKFKVLFVCIPEDVWPSNFGKCLKMPQK